MPSFGLDTLVPPHLVLQIFLLGFAWIVAGALSLATYLKWKEMQTMAAWPVTQGRITSSRVERREVDRTLPGKHSRHTTETRNFPAIAFQYKVNGRTLSSTRYSIRENVGNHNVAETLALYPKGKVVEVAYDPTNPSKAVIERTMPEGAFKALALMAALLASGSLALTMVFGNALSAVTRVLPNPQHAGLVMVMLIAAAIAGRILAMQKDMVAQTSKWASVEGYVDASGLEKFQIKMGDVGESRRWRTVFRSRVIYTYRVDGHSYASDRVAFGSITSSNVRSWVSGMARRYSQGMPVKVYYDARNPTSSVLERRVGGEWLLWVFIAALIIGAGRLAGFF